MLIGDWDVPSDASASRYATLGCSSGLGALAGWAAGAAAADSVAAGSAAGGSLGAALALGSAGGGGASAAELAGFCELQAAKINTAMGAQKFFTVRHK